MDKMEIKVIPNLKRYLENICENSQIIDKREVNICINLNPCDYRLGSYCLNKYLDKKK